MALPEMSCISGVIGKVGPFTAIAHSERKISAIDGCSLGCTKSCLDACDLKAEHYCDLSEFGFEIRSKWQDSLTENSISINNIYEDLFKQGLSFKTN